MPDEVHTKQVNGIGIIELLNVVHAPLHIAIQNLRVSMDFLIPLEVRSDSQLHLQSGPIQEKE